MKLTSEQEDAVYNFVSQHGITKQTLHDDLVDHLCFLRTAVEFGSC